MVTASLAGRVQELTASRVPFVHAVVVRAQVPTSAKAGDAAIVLGDGSIEGFVGGQCAETSVRTAALDALARGQSVLLRVLPGGEDGFPESPGAQVVVNPCLSGGALEIFLEPLLPPPLVEIVGDTPVARALVTLTEALGYLPVQSPAGTISAGTSAVVVATHGRDEPAALRAALAAGVGYIALVASRRRGCGVLDDLGLDAGERARISTPAGLDLGARTAPEVALSILAEIVQAVRAGGARAPDTSTTPVQAVDPVCGMTVTVLPDTPHATVDGVEQWFCNPGCRDHWLAEAAAGGVADAR